MLAERSLRPLPPSPAQSRPPSPRDLLPLSASRAAPARPLPLPAPLPRSQSSASLRRPLPVPPGETDALAPLRRASESAVNACEHASSSMHGPTPSTRRPGVRPLPTPVTSPFLTPDTSPLPTPASTPDATVTVFINPFEPEPISRRPVSTTLSLDDVECFGVRPKHSGHATGHVVKSKSQDFQKDDGGQVQRRVSSAARKIIARDKEEQDEAWRALLAKKNNQQNRL